MVTRHYLSLRRAIILKHLNLLLQKGFPYESIENACRRLFDKHGNTIINFVVQHGRVEMLAALIRELEI